MGGLVLDTFSTHTDVAIIGGGIVGLATAYRFLRRFPEKRLVLLEKEDGIARHQSGHNSGVLHTGIYYKPGSLRAVNCRDGKRAMEDFCQAEGIPFERCGKVIVATSNDELPRLESLYQRGRENEIECSMIGPERLRELEPHAAGIQAIHVPAAGIVDYGAVCQALAKRIQQSGGEIVLGARVTEIHADGSDIRVAHSQGEISASMAINCAGLYSDRVARLGGTAPETRIIPFRGEYYMVRESASGLVRNLIYPVPDPRFPFLGVHFTRRITGGIECGPNAVLALAREGYVKTAINPRELAETLSYPGFQRMARRYWRMGAGEMWRSFSKAAFVRSLQRLVPEITADDLEPAPAGVRAQALNRDGTLVDDFVIQENGRMINVLNAPSPAATSALNIGGVIVDRVCMSGLET